MKKEFVLLTVFCLLNFLFAGGCKGKKEEPIPKNPVKAQTEVTQQKIAQAVEFGEETVPPPKPNSPPKILSAKILPEVAVSNSDLRVEVEAEDPEGDLINYKYQWVKGKEGGTPDQSEDIEGETNPTLSHEKFVRGEAIAIKITPSDWYAEGEPFQTKFITIQNSFPQIVSSPTSGNVSKENLYTYQVEATDLDNDPITFSLIEGAPEGMSIDTSTGLITWPIPPGTAGTFKVTVKGVDGQGGNCYQRFTLSVTTEQPKPEEK